MGSRREDIPIVRVAELETRGIDPYIATGREPYHHSWRAFFAEKPVPPHADASPRVKLAYTLQTEIGRRIYGLRKCTVEPVIGIIKEVLGFRQFSLRGLTAAAGECTWYAWRSTSSGCMS
jgi:Transposase DDE domain